MVPAVSAVDASPSWAAVSDTCRPAQAPTVFSTSGPPARRVELSHNTAALIRPEVHAADQLEATELIVQPQGARLARVVGSAHTVERSAAVIAHSPADSIASYLTLRGDARTGCAPLTSRSPAPLAWKN